MRALRRQPKPNDAPAPRPACDDPEILRNRRTKKALFGALAAGEITVAVAAPIPGVLLIACTGALAAVHRKGEKLGANERARAIQVAIDRQADAFVYDRLTGLPNRQNFLDQLGREVARAGRYSYDITIATVEINRLTELEAAWGKEVAGRAVRHVADTLKRIARASDFVARIDDERFAVVLMQCTSEQALAFGERLALAVANRPLKRDEHIRVPVYVNVEVTALQFDPQRFRGPLEFLSAAGGETRRLPGDDRTPYPSRSRAADARDLRRQLVRDYYPAGTMKAFSEAYREHRDGERRAG